MRILYLDIDALRPDHLGCYGYHRNTSPHIDALAREGMRCENYYCSDAPCLPSRTAFYTGMFGIHSGVVGHGGTAADLRPEGPLRGFRDRVELYSLPSRLQQAGYYTAQISPFGQRHAARQFYAGYNEIHNTGKGGMESAEEVTPVVEKWMRANAKRDNWYLHINYWDPHTPSRVPQDQPRHFENEPLPAWLTEEVLARHQQKVGPHGAREPNMFDEKPNCFFPRSVGALRTYADLKTWIDGYDSAIRYVDDQIGKILGWLKEAGVLEDTMIIISADHGENQGELGLYGEHGTADYITCRVPFIVRWPGKVKGGTVDKAFHYNLDWAPTLAELLSISPSEMWDGQSFAATLRGQGAAGRDYLVLSQCAHVCQRSVRFGPWLYMRTYHDGFHLFPKEMLFNVETDPHEQHNLADQHRDLCDQALRHLHDWHEAMMASMPYDTDPLWTVMREGGPFHARGQLPSYCERLEKTDRGWAVPQLRERHPEEFSPRNPYLPVTE